MAWSPRKFNGILHTEPQDEVRARMKLAEMVGDSYVMVPLDLANATLVDRPPCEARTVVNGDRMSKMLVEIMCTKRIDPATRKHEGMHVNGKNSW